METTDNLALPYILPSQAQKHVTHNEALRMLDVLVQPAVLATLATPPEDPAAGLRLIVADEATDEFEGRSGQIAQFADGDWLFHVPQPGWTVFDLERESLLHHDGSSWKRLAGRLLPELALGEEIEPGPDQRLTVASPATLLTHEGDDHRLKINKASSADTASIVFQSAFSGRAEIGLPGSDGFALKVSADGEAWTDALLVEAGTGRVSFPAGGAREQLAAPRTYFVSPGGNDTASGLSAIEPFATLQRAITAALQLDPFGHQVTIQLADGTYGAGASCSRPLFDGGQLVIRGNISMPGAVEIGAGAADALIFDGAGVRARLEGLTVSGQVGVWARYGAVVLLREKMRFGTCSARQIGADNGGYVEVIGDVEIAGDSPHHILASQGGHVLMAFSSVTLTDSPTFASSFVRAEQTGLASAYGNSYTGTASGSRYAAATNGVIFVAGAGGSVFPGSTAGTVETGGQYA